MLKLYNIKNSDTFDASHYPDVEKEIEELTHTLVNIRSEHKAGIVISLLKDYSIKTEWLERDRELARLVRSSAVETSHLESLFSACKDKPKFLEGLETYLRLKLIF